LDRGGSVLMATPRALGLIRRGPVGATPPAVFRARSSEHHVHVS